MGKMSRDKGKRGELELAHILRQHGYDCKRGQQHSGTETTADIKGLKYIHPEVKRTETLSVYTAMFQAIRDAGNSGNMPAVFHRRNEQGWLVIMCLDDWLKMYEAFCLHKKTDDSFSDAT